MTKLFQRILSILCVVALMLSCIAMAFAEEANEAPVEDETVQYTVDEDAERIAAEEAARRAAEEAARQAAEEQAAQRAAEEEAARRAAEEEAARRAAEEEAARRAAEEEAAQRAAEEEAARRAAEEEAARRAAEEEARRAAEEEADRTPEEVPVTEETVETVTTDGKTEEEGLVEIDGWGYIDPEVISENVPEITDELKGLRTATMRVNEVLADTLVFGDELVITLKCGNARTVELKLYKASGAGLSVKVDGKAAGFTPAASDDPAFALSTFELNNAAGHTHTIALSASGNVSFKLAAVAKQDDQEIAPETEEPVLIEEEIEESAPAEDHPEEEEKPEEEENPEEKGKTEKEDRSENNDNPADGNEPKEGNEAKPEEKPEEKNDGNNNGNENKTVVPVKETEPVPTIQVSMKSYSALKVGKAVSDTLVAGQKAKLQIKCGKHDNIVITLNANPDDLVVKIDNGEAELTPAGNGTYSVALSNVAFRKFSIVLTAKQDLAFSLSVEDAGPVITTEEKEAASDYNKEETDSASADEAISEKAVGDVNEEPEQTESGNPEETENEVSDETVERVTEGTAEEITNTEDDITEEIVEELVEEIVTEDEDTEETGDGNTGEAEDVNPGETEDGNPEETEETEEENAGDTEGSEEVEEPEEELVEVEPEENPDTEYEEKVIDYQLSWDEATPDIGSTAHLKAIIPAESDNLSALQWQNSVDGEIYNDIEGATAKDFDVVVTMENYKLFWRVVLRTPIVSEAIE